MESLEALQKPLTGANRSESPCATEAVASRDVAALDGLGGVAAATMQPRAREFDVTTRDKPGASRCWAYGYGGKVFSLDGSKRSGQPRD